MNPRKMTRKQAGKFVKRNMLEYMGNLCVTCAKNAMCTLPLHGKFSAKGEGCQQAEMLPPLEAMQRVFDMLFSKPSGVPWEDVAPRFAARLASHEGEAELFGHLESFEKRLMKARGGESL